LQTILVDTDPRGVVRLSLTRPGVLNAFDEVMIAELTSAFGRFAEDAEVRCVVLAAEGKLFCSGADIGWMQRQSRQSYQENLRDARVFAEMMRAIYECPKPVIARVHGHAFGGGVGLMAAADIVIASRNAVFAVSEAKFGILPAVIGPYLVNAVGPRHALRLAMTTARIDAADALAMGLIHETVMPEDLDFSIERVINSLLASGPGALREIKRLFHGLSGVQIDAEVRELTAATIATVRASEEAQEGFAAFLEKRSATWVPA
jgi:methylglutaconyl-CoA hydratase